MTYGAKKNRIEALDAVRGICIILMVVYHGAFDLIEFGFLDARLIYNGLVIFLQFVFSSMFILISGISSNFSHSNVKRGFIALGAAVLVSAATYFAGALVRFGILHFLGCAMVFYGLTSRFWDRIPRYVAPILYIALFALFWKLTQGRFDLPYLGWLGFPAKDYSSADYYPILPWIFMFLLGTWLGKPVKQRRLPERFYTVRIPVLPVIGRWSLVIYLVHQPVMYGLVTLLSKLTQGVY